MTREEADFIGTMNMCDEISNEAYTKIMCHCEEQEPCEDAISRKEVLEIIEFEERWLLDCHSNNADTDIAFGSVKSKIKDLTSVQQQDVCNEARQDGYDQGLNDAWKCARKIAEREDDMRECFHGIAPARIFREYSASEAIAKIKGYEEKKKPGRWIYDTTIENWRCSKCGEILKTPGYVGTADFMEEHFKWCPHCGEKMEKGKS